MKKTTLIFMLLASFLFVGCGESDSSKGTPESTNQTNGEQNRSQLQSQAKTFTPPSWIQGTWMDRVSEPLIPTGWIFTPNDVLSVIGSHTVSGMDSVKNNDSIKQQSTASTYTYTIIHGNSTEGPFTFNKIGDDKIQFVDSLGNKFPACTRE